MYDVIYRFYNREMAKDCDYKEWAKYLNSIIGDRVSGVEIACGTGLLTFPMASLGKKIIASDISEEMLLVAESKKNSSPLSPRFVCADMLKFAYPKNSEFVFSACDGINYVSGRDIPKLFRKIYACLKEGGIFTFDVSSEYKLRNVIGNNVFYMENADGVCLWTNKLSEDGVDMELTVFSKEKDGRYIRNEEKQRQFFHKEDFLTDAMKNAGFSEVKAVDFLSSERKDAQAERLQFIGVKPQK